MKKLIGTIFLISLVMGCIQEEQEGTPPKTLSQSIDLPKEVEFLGSYEIERGISQVYSDDSPIITFLKDNHIYLFDRTTGEMLWDYIYPGELITHFAFSLGANYIVISTTNPNKVILFNIEGKKLWEYELDTESHPTQLAISGNGALVVVGSGFPENKLYFIKGGKLIKKYEYSKRETKIGAISINYDGSCTVAGSGYMCSSIFFFDKKGNLLWEYKWERRSKALFSNVTKAFISSDGNFGFAIYDSTHGACFFNKDGVFYDYEADPCPDIVASYGTEEGAIILNADGTLLKVDKNGEISEHKIWEGKILVSDQHGVYGSGILINGKCKKIERIEISSDRDYIGVLTKDKQLIFFNKEGKILWKKIFRDLMDFCIANNKVLIYKGFFEGDISVIDKNGTTIWDWSLRDNSKIIGSTLFHARFYKILYSSKNNIFVTTKISKEDKAELFFFKINDVLE